MSEYTPKPENKFTFGLWTVGNIGRDPFGGPVREQKTPAELVRLLGEVGAYGVNFHDNDLIPIDATPAEADAIKKDFRKALETPGWSSRWRPRTCSETRSSRTALLHPMIPRSALMPSKDNERH
jgi:hypothetical protein